MWLDTDRDGLQDADESGIPGVVLQLTGPSGAVTDISGAPVGPATTDADGGYLFPYQPVLGAGQHYTVTIDEEASEDALAGLEATLASSGSDRSADSSTGSATSGPLTSNGAHHPTLDFGFVTFELPTLPFPEDPEPAGQLASTGSEPAWPLGALAAGVMALGVALVAARRLRRA